MRIAFVGKGGSGKTTLASLFAAHVAERGRPVLAIDADLNQHLGPALGFSDIPPRTLGTEQAWLKRLLHGTRTDVAPEDLIKTTPPARGSRVFRGLGELRRELAGFVRERNGVALLNVGEQTDEDTAVRCYHSKTGAVELLLNHAVDGAGEYLVVDMTAGADAFASGLYDLFDLTVLAVEPTLPSLGVFRQYAGRAKALGVRVAAVGNKVLDDADRAFLRAELGDDLLGCVSLTPFVRARERGEARPLSTLEPENRAVLDAVLTLLDRQEKDWPRYFSRITEIHRKNAASWGNAARGTDLARAIDPSFSYLD